MSDRRALIDIVWGWDRLAVERSKDVEMRRGIWRILDALYDDMAMVRTPGFRAKVKAALDALKQTEEVLAVRKELGI
jgi:hypothetical protein